MSDALRGDDFLLKSGDGASPEVFTTIAGLRATSFSIDGQTVDVTDKDSGGLRELLDGGGHKSLSITADGVYKSGAGQKTLQTRAKAGTLHNYQIDDGEEVIEGAFQVASFERGGDTGAEQTFSVTLESSGDWTVT